VSAKHTQRHTQIPRIELVAQEPERERERERERENARESTRERERERKKEIESIVRIVRI